MLQRTVRNLATAGITAVLATVLTALGAVGASAAPAAAVRPGYAGVAATSPVLCSEAVTPLWPCLTIDGSGLTVTSVSTWAHNPLQATYPAGSIWSAHIEIYVTNIDEPLKPDPPNPADIGVLWNSGDFSIAPGGNSPAFDVTAGDTFTADLYVCAATWVDSGESHSLHGYACGAVYG
jgi:hypothetical protein